ncbi:hypothetical protein GCM10010363_34760 [Streptomyces omiyaensis]|nr:hypothetical protein GCM10010363_34760 [Streptomyces omiyaensis]
MPVPSTEAVVPPPFVTLFVPAPAGVTVAVTPVRRDRHARRGPPVSPPSPGGGRIRR